MIKKDWLKTVYLTCGLCLLLLSCGSRHSLTYNESEIPMAHASFLKMWKGEDYTRVEIVNPWDTAHTLHSYVLVPDSLPLPDKLPKGTLIRTPIKNSIVFSSVHSSLLEELGALEAVKGVCDTEYMHNNALLRKLKNGNIVDCGGSMAPDLEKIIALNADALFLSPYQDPSPYAKLVELGVPIVECADYMETTPLGRMEWIKFYSALVGKEGEGEKLIKDIEGEYSRLKEIAANVKHRPMVLTELKQGDAWFLPSERSTTAVFIKDAGGKLPDIVEKDGASTSFSPEKVLMSAKNADFWIIKYYNDNDMTRDWVANESGIYEKFDAFKKDRMYGCNTSKVWYYEDVPFHPHWLLADMISVFHPELDVKPYPGRKYYTKLN